MTTQKEMRRINKLLEVIQKEGKIGKIRLIMQSGISISYYEKLRPFLEEIYSHKVQYDMNTKMWCSLETKSTN
jgi:hypothetical protein